jgi:hypothetical protein
MDRITPITTRVPAPIAPVPSLRRLSRKDREERDEQRRRARPDADPATAGEEPRDDGHPHVDVLA